MKYTPGPWQLRGPFLKPWPQSGVEREIQLCGKTKPDGWETFLASIVWNDSDPDKEAEFRANARLIAAAPEMFEIMVEVWAQMDTPYINHTPFLTDETVDKFKRVLAKAGRVV